MTKETTINSGGHDLSELDVHLLQLREAARSGEWQLTATKGDDGVRLYQVEIRPRTVPVSEPEPHGKPPRKARKSLE